MESRLRLLIVLAGLPEPKVDHKFYDEHGRVRRRLDLRYLVIRLIVEYDGRQHAGSLEHWGEDLERREEFDDDGWRILVVRARRRHLQVPRADPPAHSPAAGRAWVAEGATARRWVAGALPGTLSGKIERRSRAIVRPGQRLLTPARA